MKRAMFVGMLVMCMFVSLTSAAINQDLGTSTSLFVGTAGPASSGTQVMVDKAQQNQSGWRFGDQSYQLMASGNVTSGRRGSAMVSIETGDLLTQNVGRNHVNQNALSETSVMTDVYGRGTASACVGKFTSQNAPGAMDMTSVMIMSTSSVMGSFGPCGGSMGSATNCVNVGTMESASVSSGCGF